jgi:type I restriction enzyme M protein
MARAAKANGGNGARVDGPQSLNAAVWSICDVLRRSNCAGALQYVPELTWILFLRVLDSMEARDEDEAAQSSDTGEFRRLPAAVARQDKLRTKLVDEPERIRGKELRFESRQSQSQT